MKAPILWILSVQYFVVQIIVANSWTTPFSVQNNPISDLGNTVCGEYSGRYVCSPMHDLMNISFVVLGLTMIWGSLLFARQYMKEPWVKFGLYLLALSGLGTILVGLYPENTIASLHVIGATLPFLLGNIALIILGLKLDIPKALRVYTIASGSLALFALALFLSGSYLGLGHGGMERLVAYPQTIWMIVYGIYLSSIKWAPSTK